MKAVLRLARRDGHITTNPADDVKVPPIAPVRDRVALSDEQLVGLLSAAEETDPDSAVLVHLMARCGLRIGEAIALRWTDINFVEGTIDVRRSQSRREGLRPVKGRHSEEDGRTFRMPSDVCNRLRRHLREKGVSDLTARVATSKAGRPVDYGNWRQREWTSICQRAGLQIRCHVLRRTAATRLMRNDQWSPAAVQALLGHRDARTTLDLYTKINADELPAPSDLRTESA